MAVHPVNQLDVLHCDLHEKPCSHARLYNSHLGRVRMRGSAAAAELQPCQGVVARSGSGGGGACLYDRVCGTCNGRVVC